MVRVVRGMELALKRTDFLHTYNMGVGLVPLSIKPQSALACSSGTMRLLSPYFRCQDVGCEDAQLP